MTKSDIIVIVGPTASGKSALAVEIARKLNGEIISADSRQVYRGLTIGSGKISKKEMRGIPHHLLDVVSPKKVFTAADFVRSGRAAIADIQSRGKMVIVCGGTGFYIDALLGRIALSQVPPNTALRSTLSSKSPKQLFAILKRRDPRRAAQMDTSSERNNALRLIRAIEVASSKSKSPQIPDMRYDAQWIGIHWHPDTLKKRIGKRLTDRLRSGMYAEARRLHAAGLSYKRMESLGLEYRSLARYLRGIISRSELEVELARDIIRYSKKQMMYWRRNHAIVWLPAPVSTVQATRHLGAPKARVRAQAQP